jgi:predicted DCC family thiol-disulfide oxidoreductase YuxK
MRVYVLYDAGCGLCSHLVQWMSQQRARCELQFVAAGSDEARRLFPNFRSPARPEELVVISEDGAVYRGDAAYIVLLYALDSYRAVAVQLAKPAYRPFARKVFSMLSTNRLRLSQLLGFRSTDVLARAVANSAPDALDSKREPTW